MGTTTRGRSGMKPGRNDRCPCGSGKKYKVCCLKTDQEASRAGAAAVLRDESVLPALLDPVLHPPPAPEPRVLTEEEERYEARWREFWKAYQAADFDGR